MDVIFPDRHDGGMADKDLTILKTRIVERMAALKLKPAPLAKSIGKNDSFVRDILRKGAMPGADNLQLLADALKTTLDYLLGKSDQVQPDPTAATIVPLMGEIGAGAEISPEYEQVPEDGIDQIEVPFALPGDMIAFRVKGVSMLPRYDEGDVVVAWAEQRRALETFYGEEAAVRTKAGHRYLKKIRRAPRGVTLESFNADPIESVELAWIGEIYVTIRASQYRRVSRG